MNILVLGATGFIGSAIVRRLLAEGHAVTGLGRNPERSRHQLKAARWLKSDLSNLTQAADWTQLLVGQHIVINCAGALQDGLNDDLSASQERAMLALYQAAAQAGIRLVVQISANTEAAGAKTGFLSTKRRADEALAASGLPHVIFRPALVLGRNAFGGTALLRALAATPFFLPLAYADSQVATVALADVAECVAKAVAGEIAPGGDHDLAAPGTERLGGLVQLHRDWLGLRPAPIMPVPAFCAVPVSWVADRLGQLGWRSPLRSTAIAVMAGGVTTRQNTPSPIDYRFETAAETLANNPAGVQDLWFARFFLLKPMVFAVLSLFWLASGLIPLIDPQGAAAYMLPFMPHGLALALTFLTCAVDIALGLAVAYRPWSRSALVGMLAVSFTYLAGATVLTPELWLHPLGPLVKVVPSMMLTLLALAMLEER